MKITQDLPSYIYFTDFVAKAKSCGTWIKAGQTALTCGANVTPIRRQLLNLLRHCCFDLMAKSLPLFNFWKPRDGDDGVDVRLQKLAEAIHQQLFLGFTSVQYQENLGVGDFRRIGETRTVCLLTVEGTQLLIFSPRIKNI